jgi:hypothetical protein
MASTEWKDSSRSERRSARRQAGHYHGLLPVRVDRDLSRAQKEISIFCQSIPIPHALLALMGITASYSEA